MNGLHRRRRLGFTLLEVLVALTLLSVIVVIGFSALRLGSRSWEAGLTRAGASDDLRSAQGFLRRQLGQAVALTWRDKARARIAFRGGPQGLRFIAPPPQQGGPAGLYEVAVEAVTDADEVRLVLHHLPHDPSRSEFSDEQEEEPLVLAGGLDNVTFEYFGSEGQGEPGRWTSTWDEEAPGLPELVRIQADTGEGRNDWPLLLVAPRSARGR